MLTMLVESTVPVVIRFSKLALVEQDFWIYVSIRGPHIGSGRRLINQDKKSTQRMFIQARFVPGAS